MPRRFKTSKVEAKMVRFQVAGQKVEQTFSGAEEPPS